MTFTSLAFLVFLPAVTALFYLLPPRMRWLLLLLASCYFYMAFVPKYILILFLLIVVDFSLGIIIEDSQRNVRSWYLLGSIASNLSLLFIFKYFNFFNGNIAALAHALDWNYSIGSLSLLLPLGLSFHTFQSLSYVIEVYRGTIKAERRLGIYALYVMFFPQLVAGPIERPAHLLPQLRQDTPFSWSNIFDGLELIAWGFFKKIVIADRLGIAVDYVYGHISTVPGPSILFAAVFFSFQLYADFSAYSDIARGAARLLGIDVIRNFDRPYSSHSVGEFWRRWHISLSSWLRDYVYIPLGGSRVTKSRWAINIAIVFLLSGLWHGAGWTFVCMGLLYAFFIILGDLTIGFRDAVARSLRLHQILYVRDVIRIAVTFVLITFAWIFFRAPDLSTAVAFISRLGHDADLGSVLHQPILALGFSTSDLMLSIAGILTMLLVEHFQELGWDGRFNRPFVRSLAYSGLILSIFVFGVFVTRQFIYFQF